jgi:hypothetical protein
MIFAGSTVALFLVNVICIKERRDKLMVSQDNWDNGSLL